jgi:arylsulfatase A-like enzyme/Tfp pilus assembly protein PilF
MQPRSQEDTKKNNQTGFLRVFVSSWLHLFLVVLVAACGSGACNRASQRPRLILLISIDTTRADHLRPYGGTVAVPNIEALAADGVLYKAAYSHSPQTLPSHASLLTGLLPFEHGARDNVGFTVDARATTLAQRLHEAGYATGAAVSSYILRKETGVDRGFDQYDAKLTMAAGPDVTIAQVQRAGPETITVAKDWIAAHDKQPAFFFLHLYEPHTPYSPPSPYREQYTSPYDGEIAYADALVGGLIEFLKTRALYEPALIILTSDHGEGLGDHDEQEHGIFLYQGVAHVPLVIKWPGPPRRSPAVAAAVQLIDVAPTIAAVAGSPADKAWRGRSLVEDPDRAGAPPRAIYSESMYPRYHFGWSELYALTDGHLRYIMAPRDELYDLDRDAAEANNLAADRRQIRDNMRTALAPLVQPAGSTRPREVSAEDLEKFQALGYVGMSAQPTAAPDQTLPDPKDKIGIFKTYRETIQLARTGHYTEAIEGYKKILADNPQMLDVWERLVTVLQRADRGDEAMLVMRRIIALAPDNPGAHLRLGRALARRKQFDDAVKEARTALAQDPAQANELLARIEFERGRPDDAVPFADAASQADPRLPLPFYIRGLALYQKGQYAAALPFFEKGAAALESRPGLTVPGLYLHLGDCLFRANRRDEAGKALATEVRLYPENLEARARLGAYYLAVGQRTAFTEVFNELVRRSPTPRNFQFAIQALTEAGEADAARRLTETARGAPRD